MPKTITHLCPECSNDEFRILDTVIKAGTVRMVKNPHTKKDRAVRMSAGRYRVECTCCGRLEVVVGKNPDSYPEDKHL